MTDAPPSNGKSITARRGRSAARLAAVQALYQMELTGEDSDHVAQQFVEHRFDDKVGLDAAFFSAIVHGVPRHQTEIDRSVQRALSADWQLKRIDATLRAILRAAVYELVAEREVPARVIIDEYVEVSHAFFQREEPSFVNAALDTISRRKRAQEFGGAPPDDELEF